MKARTCALILLLGLSGQSSAASKSVSDPNREVIVLLRPGALTLSDSRSEYPINQAAFRDGSLAALLTARAVQAVARACPDAKPTDARKHLPDGRIIVLMDLSNLFRIRVPDGVRREDLIAQLRANQEVLLAELNGSIHYRAQPNDTLFQRQWNLQNIGQSGGAPRADIDAVRGWDVGTGVGDTRIGVVDEFGVDANHEDLIGRVTGQIGLGNRATRARRGVCVCISAQCPRNGRHARAERIGRLPK